MDVIIEEINFNDWPFIENEIIKVEKDAFEDEVRFKKEDFENTFKNPLMSGVVVKFNGKIIAYSTGFPEDTNFYIESVAVIKNFQGKGIGKKMLIKFIEIITSKGYKSISMHATSQAMKEIAQKLGFKEVQFINKYVGNRDAWYMIKIL